MRVVIAGGGTGGHTSPGLAVAARLRASGVDVHWIGSRAGIEAKRVPEAGVTFHTIPVGKLRRYWDWQNVPDLAVRAPAGLAQSWRLLRRLRPALLLATGGFVALPPALAARTLGIPLVIHEQTSVPGLANRVAGRFARCIALTFPLTGTEFPKERTVLTGNPLRPEPLRRRYALAAYVGAELRDVYAAAALVVGRSGAGTVNECCQLGLAALYVPLPGTSGDEQTANARLVEAAGGAVAFPQVSLTPDGLVEAVARLLADRAALVAMGQRARSLAVPDAADRIARVLFEVAGAGR